MLFNDTHLPFRAMRKKWIRNEHVMAQEPVLCNILSLMCASFILRWVGCVSLGKISACITTRPSQF